MAYPASIIVTNCDAHFLADLLKYLAGDYTDEKVFPFLEVRTKSSVKALIKKMTEEERKSLPIETLYLAEGVVNKQGELVKGNQNSSMEHARRGRIFATLRETHGNILTIEKLCTYTKNELIWCIDGIGKYRATYIDSMLEKLGFHLVSEAQRAAERKKEEASKKKKPKNEVTYSFVDLFPPISYADVGIPGRLSFFL